MTSKTKEIIVEATLDMTANVRLQNFNNALREESRARDMERKSATKAASRRLGRTPMPSEITPKDWPNGKGPSDVTPVREVVVEKLST